MSEPYHPPYPFRRTSRYGTRIDPVSGKEKFHAGEDWAAPAGTPIPAATPGKVVYSGFNPGFGNTVIVRTTNGYSLYAHMNETPKVGVGQQIWPGDILGGVGNTGSFSRGNHLHYSVITRGTPNSEGKIGVNVDKDHTTDPALFDAAIRYPNETLQAGRAMFGPDSTSNAAALTRPGRPTGAFPLNQFESGPRIAPIFVDRFGNWEPPSSENGTSAPVASSGGLPALIRDEIRRRNQQVTGISQLPSLVDGTQLLPDDGEESFADRFGDEPPVRRLSSSGRLR